LIHFLVFVIILVMIYVFMLKINASMQIVLLLEKLTSIIYDLGIYLLK